MVRLAISVEGQTEEIFITRLILPFLQQHGIFDVHTISINGDVSIPRVRRELNTLATSFDKVTTLYDFYGFRGKDSTETKETLENKIKGSVSPALQHKIIPYIQMYEYEGLLFTSPQAIENNIEAGLADWAKNVLNQFGGNPEKINNSAQTAPSKRLLSKTTYIKTIHGPNIAAEIGLATLRENCAGFNQWLTTLESL